MSSIQNALPDPTGFLTRRKCAATVRKLLYLPTLGGGMVGGEGFAADEAWRMAPRQTEPERSSSSPRSLGDACRSQGLDVFGLRCPGCPLKALCMTETRWVVSRAPRQSYLI
jgi:hypothetical protein